VNELKRQQTKRELILGLLRSRGDKGITNAELSEISLRYGGHLGKLYELGYKIRKDALGDGLFNYTLIEEPSREIHERKSAYETLMSRVREEEIIDASMLDSILNELGIAVRYKPYTYTQM
jgi:hypothetical protein